METGREEREGREGKMEERRKENCEESEGKGRKEKYWQLSGRGSGVEMVLRM